MAHENPRDRRAWLRGAAYLGASAVLTPAIHAAQAHPTETAKPDKEEKEEDDVSPNEDLMREHGLLVRCLVIYREAIRRIDAKHDLPPDALAGTATLIRDFVENYHEKLEEDYLFPRFHKAGRLVDLVNVLDTQHKRGRIVTGNIIHLATAAALGNDSDRQKLRGYLEMFVNMYLPHEAREDTVLFPAFKKLVSRHEYDALGEEFEKKENQLFGEGGFEKNVAKVADLEKRLGVNDLAKFTPLV